MRAGVSVNGTIQRSRDEAGWRTQPDVHSSPGGCLTRLAAARPIRLNRNKMAPASRAWPRRRSKCADLGLRLSLKSTRVADDHALARARTPGTPRERCNGGHFWRRRCAGLERMYVRYEGFVPHVHALPDARSREGPIRANRTHRLRGRRNEGGRSRPRSLLAVRGRYSRAQVATRGPRSLLAGPGRYSRGQAPLPRAGARRYSRGQPLPVGPDSPGGRDPVADAPAVAPTPLTTCSCSASAGWYVSDPAAGRGEGIPETGSPQSGSSWRPLCVASKAPPATSVRGRLP